MTPSEENLRIRAGNRELDCYLALPTPAAGRHPAIVVVHEIFGVDGHVREVARRFSALGYVAAAPNLFTGPIQQVMTPANIALAMQSFAQAPPDLRRDPSKLAAFAASQPPERRPVLEAFGRVSSPAAQTDFAQDLLAVTTALRERADVDPDRIGSVGFCFGGAMTARLATVDPKLRAAVIFYGQNPPLADVPHIRASVLGLYGEKDVGISSTVPDLARAMDAAGVRFESHIYPGAGHAFFNDTRPTTYHEPSARDAWPRVGAFLASTLGGAPPAPP
ncbi:MAG: dienelactone hydrolase family protein [Thermoplasmata archaeon]